MSAAVVVSNIFVMRYPLLDHQVDKFTNLQRLMLYAPFILCAAGFLVLSRRGGQSHSVEEAPQRHALKHSARQTSREKRG